MSNNRKCPAVWPTDHVVELLARLDLLIGIIGPTQIPRTDIKSETDKQHILTELHKGFSVNYSQEQIEQKLYDMYEEGDGWADWNFSRVFWFGSSEMHTLGKEMKSKVLERFKNLQMTTPRQRRAIAQSHQTQDKRKPGSISVRDKKPARTHLRKLARKTPGQMQASRKHGPLKIYGPKRQASLPTIEAASSELTPQSNAKVKSDSQPDPDTRRTSESNYDHRINNFSSMLTDSTSQTPNLSQSCQKLCNDDTLLRSNILEMISVPKRDYEKLVVDLEEYRRVEAERKLKWDDRSKLVYEELLADQAYYRDRCLRAEAKCETLELVDRQRASLFAEGKGFPVEMQNALRRKSVKMAELENQVYNQRYFRQFISLDTIPRRATNSTRISTTYTEMKSQLMSLSVLHGLQHPLSHALHNKSPDLSLLLCGTLCGKGYPDNHICTSPTYNGISANKIVQSLTGAALQEWIFCTNFQESFQCASLINTPLLDRFRILVSGIGDTELLHSLEVAAYQSVVTGEHIQQVFIPRIATRLAERFLIVLQPFISHDTNSETAFLLKQKLELIFHLAMEVKILAMTSRAMYECIWPVPKSAVEGNSMIIERPDSAQASIEMIAQHIPLVRLTLVPGLRIWKYEKRTVDHYGFVRGEEEGLEAPELMIKAVVLI